jgi:LmbE family N-acetylglucosaminyl deacetylase
MFDMNKGVWLVLTLHMDSETIGMGGTIAIPVKSSYQLVVAYLTDGAVAYEGGVLQGSEKQQYFSKRKSEAKETLGVLGALATGWCS